jgi:hypothetical protein
LFFQIRKQSPLSFQKTKFQPEKSTQLFRDELIRQEAFAVEILNATQQSGLAQKAAVFWENLGGRVIRVGDYKESLDRTKLIVNGEVAKSYSFKVLKFFFNPDCLLVEENVSRVDMSLVLGEDYWKIMAEKW